MCSTLSLLVASSQLCSPHTGMAALNTSCWGDLWGLLPQKGSVQAGEWNNKEEAASKADGKEATPGHCLKQAQLDLVFPLPSSLFSLTFFAVQGHHFKKTHRSLQLSRQAHHSLSENAGEDLKISLVLCLKA